jgi:hypothetical protein
MFALVEKERVGVSPVNVEIPEKSVRMGEGEKWGILGVNSPVRHETYPKD